MVRGVAPLCAVRAHVLSAQNLQASLAVTFSRTADSALSVTLVCVALVGGAATVDAQQPAPALAEATLEELMDIRVTSAARKSQRAEDVAAAVFVITSDDIRRSGHTTLPEVLRLAPGVHVAQVTASRWAVSIRGFNDVYANKLLVLVDGRSIYTRTFSGVLWDMQDLMLSDIERIEVIRGPGGAAWGANAVNGVINIITRSATETPGLALDVGVGTFARARTGVRYGGRLAGAAYRVYSQWSGVADSGPAGPQAFSDRWQSLTSGIRTDWSRGADAVLVQGHLTLNNTRPGWLLRERLVPGGPVVSDGEAHAREFGVLSRWVRTRTDGTVVQVQGHHTSTHRDEPIIEFTERSSEVDAQYETRLGRHHGIMLGGGYRHVDLSSRGTLSMQMGSARISTLGAFAQDEIALHENLALTLGSKLEYDTFGGWGLLPSARVIWNASRHQRVWAAVSRARRTPSMIERDFRLVLAVQPNPVAPVVVSAIGSSTYASEHLVQTEVGHRTRIGPRAALDTTIFSGGYRDLRAYEPNDVTLDASHGAPLALLDASPVNRARARASGVEFAGHWTPLPVWRLDGSYSFLRLTSGIDAGRPDGGSDSVLASLASAAPGTMAPAHQWQARSTVTPFSGLQLGASLARTGELEGLRVPAFTRVDVRAAYSLNSRLTAAIVGQNLSRARHVEYSSGYVFLAKDIPRSVRVDVRWEF